MTDIQVLRAITESQPDLFVPSTGVEITVCLELDHPPLCIKTADGYWELQAWGRSPDQGVWKLTYIYHATTMYCIEVTAGGAGWFEVGGTRSRDGDKLQKSVDTMNAATVVKQAAWPFRVKVCE